jgi:hypothetical protein
MRHFEKCDISCFDERMKYLESVFALLKGTGSPVPPNAIALRLQPLRFPCIVRQRCSEVRAFGYCVNLQRIAMKMKGTSAAEAAFYLQR